MDRAVEPKALSEAKLLFLVGAVQFINILDFMMVMPLGPDFARALDIPASELGLVGGSYTAAAAISGLLGAFYLDKLDRKTALILAMLGLVAGTAAGGFATGLGSLLATRVWAGAFGGPATAVALAIVTDVVPPERRGRAMGAVMGAFSVASVLGVPIGLELARLGSWRLPFFAVAALGLAVVAFTFVVMPSLRGHLEAKARAPAARGPGLAFLLRPTVGLALLSTVVAMFGNFAVIPNLSAYLQFNLDYPRERLGLLYLVGGVVSFATMRIAGRLADKIGPARAATIGTVLYVPMIYVGFVLPNPFLPVLVLFTTFMVTGSFRVVPMQALSSRVPRPEERARFMSTQSAAQHLASAMGAMLSSRLLGTLPDGRLDGMPRVAWLAIALGCLLPVLLFRVQSNVEAGA